MTDFLTHFHFLRPLWLCALIPTVALCFWLVRHQTTANQWSRYINPTLLTHLLDKQHIKQKRWPLWCALALWVTTCISLAGPTWKQLPQPVEQTAEALVICWDLSPSMLAEDVQPSRLTRARLKIIDLLKSRNEGLFALVAYSGEAYNVTPLTDDIQTLINLLPALSPAHLPSVGSNPEMAFENAQKLLKDAGATNGHIVFVTDGIAPNAQNYLEDEIRASNYKLTLWPVGTTEGAPIPLPSGGFAKDGTGNMVIPKLDEKSLQTFAAQTNAYYVPMVTTDDDIKTLNQLLKPQSTDTAKTERNFDQWFEHGQYIPLLLLPFLLLLFRKGWLFSFMLVSSVLFTSPRSEASVWQDLWLTKDQQAQQALDAGNENAAKEFSSPARRGSALYQQGKLEESIQEFNNMESAIGDYNQGTALTRSGNYGQAIKAFDKAIEKNPNFEKAIANKAIAQQLAELQKQMQDQQNQKNQNGDSEPQNQGSQDQQSQEQQSQQQQSQEQQSQEQQSQEQQSQNSESQQGSDSQQQSQQQSNSASDQQSDDSQDGDNQNQQASQEGEQNSEENPYSNVEAKEDASNDAEVKQQMVQTEESEENAEQQKQQAVTLTGASQGEQTEEEQKLELMLRKVPDDPGGLLREKFKHQYRQRKQDPTQSITNTEAESRW